MSFVAGFVHRQFLYAPPIPTKRFDGKTIIVTGANSGLGLEASRWFARLGASKVILACRNIDKGRVALQDIRTTESCGASTLEVWQLNMSSYSSILAFSERAVAELPRVDAVVANAGLLTLNFKIAEGNEETITTNVVSTALLAFLLHPKLRETAKDFQTRTHITITASELYEVARFKERNASTTQIFKTLNSKETAVMSDRYSVSKLLIMFVMRQIAAMSPVDSSGVIINAVAPGLCQSGLFREMDDFRGAWVFRLLLRLSARKTEVGARTLVHGATVGGDGHGQYIPDWIAPMKGLMAGKEGQVLQERVWVELREKLESIKPGVTSL